MIPSRLRRQSLLKMIEGLAAKRRLVFSILVGVLLLVLGISRGTFVESGYSVNYDSKPPANVLRGLKFVESAVSMGAEYRFNSENPNDPLTNYRNETNPPALAIHDLNRDGFLDIVVSGALAPKVFLNREGQRFEATEFRFGFEDQRISPTAMVIFADFNNDGLDDVLVSAMPRHRLYYAKTNPDPKTKQLYPIVFEKQYERLQKYYSKPEGVAVLDFNLDGRLDLIFGNFVAKPGEKPSETLWLGATRHENQGGGVNDLLLQKEDGKFEVSKSVDFLTRSYTHSVGVSDLNQDGYPDIFFANDYANDELFLNRAGKFVLDVTESRIPKRLHGNSGMNGEIVDFDMDGLADIYVTNIYKPPFVRSFNILWKQNPDGSFSVRSNSKQVARCGFSWAAKFADFNNDGWLDLAVANGRNRGLHNAKEGELQSLWYRRGMVGRIPNGLRQFYYENKLPGAKYTVSAYERDCLFINDGEQFWDVAPFVGITSRFEGRPLAITDIENDGKVDFVVGNLNGPLEVYRNFSELNGNWLGLGFQTSTGSEYPIGAKVRVVCDDGVVLYREFYPANGYRAQSDPRLHFGLGRRTVREVIIEWKPGLVETFAISRLNQYVRLKQGGGRRD